ncbi:MAG: hypothetical protein IPM32_12095 [Ignavibacteriae bacterium]|nr:hypothetical protein [Ignavibacteriota bacterium]
MRILAKTILVLSIFFSFYSCTFPTYKVTSLNLDTLSDGKHFNVQAKIFKNDNSIVLFPNGFTSSENIIIGEIEKFNFSSKEKYIQKITIPFDSISAMITYEDSTKSESYFASFLLGLTGPPLTILGIYCIACPKCCFGSCPTIYSFDGNNYNLEVELFSECISKQLENNDLDLFQQNISSDTLKLKITNEAMETHYINKFEISCAEYSNNKKVFPSIENKIISFTNLFEIQKISSKNGNQISHLISKDDNNYYRTGVEKVSELKNGPYFDYIDFEIPKNATKILVKYRNTLLSTTLLYDIVIGSQGLDAINWIDKMNNDPIYASQFKTVYELFSGMKAKLITKNNEIEVGRFLDAGPLNWKYLAMEVPKNKSEINILRLEFIPDNFMIDYIAYDTTNYVDGEIEISTLTPNKILDNAGNPCPNLWEFIINDDEKYLKTEPGDAYELFYNITQKENKSKSIFIKSKGYYNEWIRGNWINEKNPIYTFNLFDINGTLRKLAESWKENHDLLEEEFFKSKISLKEGK